MQRNHVRSRDMKKNSGFGLSALALLTALSVPTNANEHAVESLVAAIRIETVSQQDLGSIDYTAFDEFKSFLSGRYPTVFSQLQVDVIADYSLVITLPGTNNTLKPVLLDSHYDVVPVEPGTEDEWTHAPFAGVVADGYVWGRGAIDDKASVIATMEALEFLLLSGFIPERTLIFSLAHDEEIGGSNGAANIAKYLTAQNIELEFMIAEGGLVVEDNPMLPGQSMAMIALAEKTYVTLTLKAEGDGGHSSMPVENNAVVNLSRAVTTLHENPFEPQLVPPMTDMLKIMGDHIGGMQGWLMSNQWLSAPILEAMLSRDPATNAQVRSTTAVTMFSAGIKENVISQKAEAKVNFRLLPGYSPEQLVEDVTALIDDPSITIDAQSWKKSPPVADIHGHGYDKVKTAIESVLPNTLVAPGMLTATTDSPHYQTLAPNIYRFHPFSLPMSHTKAIHGTNERISLESVANSVKLSTALIRSVAQP